MGEVVYNSRAKYRKKPVEIEAMRFEGVDQADELIEWSEGKVVYCEVGGEGRETHGFLAINTLEGRMRANPGDWIIKGVKGEFYPCKPDIFDITYEKVKDERI